MEVGESLKFENNTLIDLVICPHMNITPVILAITRKFQLVFLLDTQGQLYFQFSECSWAADGKKECKRLNYAFVCTLDDLYQKIENLKAYKDFILVLDSVTFVCDMAPLQIKTFSSILWKIIYECNATIITINHFRLDKQRDVYRLVPRMGAFWRKVVSYQVEFNISQNFDEYKWMENKMEDL